MDENRNVNCVNCVDCYNCIDCIDCYNCIDCIDCYNCIDCTDVVNYKQLQEKLSTKALLITEDSYLSLNGASKFGLGRPALYKKYQEGRVKRELLKDSM